MEREDLAALFGRVTRRLASAERPLLAAHGLTMWQYTALYRLAGGQAESQASLAEAMRYDKTRLISLLDELESEGLVARERDPADRRAHTVRLTPAGHERYLAARADIRTMEDQLLSEFSAAQQRSLIAVLTRLAPSDRTER